MSEPVEQNQPQQGSVPGSPQKGNQATSGKAAGGPKNNKYDRRKSQSYGQKSNGSGSKHFQKYNQPYGVHAGYIPGYGVAEYNPMYYSQYQQQQQMYAAYQNPMTGQGYVAPVVASSSPRAKPAKVEITNKSGEHIDISSMSHHHPHAALVTPSPSASPADEVKVQSPVNTTIEVEPVKEEKQGKDKVIVNDFLEQVKRRKAQLAAKKASEDQVVEEPAPQQAPVDETVQIQEGSEEVDSTEPGQAEPSEAKPLTLAEKLKLKRMEAAKQAGLDEAEKEPSPATAEEAEPEGKQSEKDKPEQDIKEEVKEENTEAPVEDGSELSTAEPTEVASSVPVEEQPASGPESTATEPEAAATEPEAESSKPEDTEKAEVLEDESAATNEVELDAEELAKITMTDFLKRVHEVPAVDDIYAFEYPTDITPPNDRYKRASVKYAYGPDFLYQFKEKLNIRYDPEWMAEMTSKIVIPQKKAGSSGRGDDRFSKGKVGSLRGEGRSNSRSSSKRKSKKDDRRSNRSYTSRKDREKIREEGADEPKIEVAPLIPSANRWVPKSKMKKTEAKLAPDGTEIYDEEEVSRKMKSLLNKLTLEMFDPISDDIMNIANQSKWQEKGETLKVVIEQIFHKACDEPHWSSMYAQLCGKVVKDLDSEIKDSETPDKMGSHLVLHYLVQRCQTEFQKGWNDKLPTSEDGTPLQPEMMSDEYYKMAAAKRRGLGLVRFIGYLFRSNLLTSRMVFFCFKRLMKDIQNSPTDDTLESVCELLETIGEQFETAQVQITPDAVIDGSSLLDTLFEQLKGVVDSGVTSSRIKFKLIDIVELREKKNWNSSKKNDGPKTIAQIHEEEALKRALEEKEKERHGSKGGSRRMNSERSSSKRDMAPPSQSKDGFTTTRSASMRFAEQKKEEPAPTPTKSSGVANMFDALMDAGDD